MTKDRAAEAYYRERFAGGRRAFGRAADYLALRAVAFAAVYLFFRPRAARQSVALLLAALLTAAFSLALRVVREARYAAFKRRERAQLSGRLLSQRLMLLPETRFIELCDRICAPDRIPCPLQLAEPAGADAVLRFARAAGGRPISVYATAGYTKQAESLARLPGVDAQLVSPDALKRAAGPELLPDAADLDEAAAQHFRSRREARRVLRTAPFRAGASGKYLIAAAVLTVASFLTGYSLYYRLLAGLCTLLSMLAALLSRRNASAASAHTMH